MSKNDGQEVPARMKGKAYAKELRKLQTELCLLQDWLLPAGMPTRGRAT
jgi:hypothetical protein